MFSSRICSTEWLYSYVNQSDSFKYFVAYFSYNILLIAISVRIFCKIYIIGEVARMLHYFLGYMITNLIITVSDHSDRLIMMLYLCAYEHVT